MTNCYLQPTFLFGIEDQWSMKTNTVDIFNHARAWMLAHLDMSLDLSVQVAFCSFLRQCIHAFRWLVTSNGCLIRCLRTRCINAMLAQIIHLFPAMQHSLLDHFEMFELDIIIHICLKTMHSRPQIIGCIKRMMRLRTRCIFAIFFY